MAGKFAEVQPGGSLILAWQVKGKKVLVVGGGEVAAGRILNCLNADAKVTVVCPASGLNDEVAFRVAEQQVTHVDRVFEPTDLDDADMALVAIDDPAASTAIWKLCRERKVPANIADVPPECDFFFGSVHRDGPLQIMVSTNGKGPRLAASIRRFLAKQLPKNAGNAIETIGMLRTKLRRVAPNAEDSPNRMRWMTKVSDTYDWAEMCTLTEEDMDNLLLFYPANKAPPMDILVALRGGTDVTKLDVFDGSFGFSVGAHHRLWTRARMASPTDVDQGPPPLFNTTFSTHTVSPLYIGRQGLTPSRLEHLARRLRDTLVGDVVRGIQIALEATDTPSGQVGALRDVSIRRFQLETIVGVGSSHDDREAGIWIDISHEKATYAALLMPGSTDGGQWKTARFSKEDGDFDASQFLDLPLLLLRMPQSLRAVICEWLSTTFDCRVRRLSLGTRTLVSVMEDWFDVAGVPSKGTDLVLTLGFNVPFVPPPAEEADAYADADADDAIILDEDQVAAEPGLRVLEVTIASSDLGRFWRYGKAHGAYKRAKASRWQQDASERRRLAGGNVDDGWGWRQEDEKGPTHALTEALARYLDHHLAFDLFHPGVRVVQISCGAFILAQSRLKLVKVGGGEVSEDVVRAAWMFVTQLGARVGMS
ncbi:hypothetical protein CP532_1532 [Ophiocordyceps camponoti-leonardi (nom. inval.)]|nr:hypothetical protein CP532_1532 [Ophiocordyceps camponoti-leonardi (nom. inval.)]